MIDQTPGETYFAQVPDISVRAAEVGSKFLSYSTGIENSQVAQNKSLPPEEWTGAAADAASEEIKILGEKATELAQVFPKAKSALDEWPVAVSDARSTIDSIRQQWDSAISTYNSAIRNANKLAGNDPDKKLMTDTAYQTAEAEQTRLKDEYTTCINNLDDSAQTVADKLLEVRRGYVSDEAVSRGRSGVGVALFGSDTPILSGAAQWADAQEKASWIAVALKTEPMTPEKVKEINEKYGQYLSNPFYANAIAQYMTVDELNNAVLRIRMTAYDKHGLFANSNFEDLNKNLGTLMVLATGGSNLSDEMLGSQKSFDLVSDVLIGKDGQHITDIQNTKLQELQETGRKTYSIPAGPGGATVAPLEGYSIFTQLAGVAARENPSLTLGPAFYAPASGKSVFADIVDWDHEGTRSAFWPGGSNQLCGLDYKTREHPWTPANLQLIDPVQTLLNLSDTPDYLETSGDAELWKAENERLGALRKVLDSDTSFDVTTYDVHNGEKSSNSGKMSIARYLTGSRRNSWSLDFGYLDDGDALGEVMNDASKHDFGAAPMVPPSSSDYPSGVEDPDYKKAEAAYNAWRDDDKRRARIAQGFLLGYQDGLDQNDYTADKGEDLFGYHNSKMRPWVAEVAASRADDLAKILETAGTGLADGSNNRGDGGYAQMNMTKQEVQELVAKNGLFSDIARDSSALTRLREAAWAGYEYTAQETVQNSSFDTNWQSNLQSNLRGWDRLIAGLDAGEVNAGLATAEEVAEYNEKKRAVVDYVIGKIPTDKVPLADLLQKGTDALIKDPMYEKFWPTGVPKETIAERVAIEQKTETKINDAVISAFIARDNWPNASGLTKDELISDFLETKGLDCGLSPTQAMPDFGAMTAEQRSALIGYLTGKVDGDDDRKTDFGHVVTAVDGNLDEAKAWVKDCNSEVNEPAKF